MYHKRRHAYKHAFFYLLCYLTFINRNPFNVTKSVAPISATIAIHSVNQPGMTSSRANNFIPNENVIFCLITFRVWRLSLTMNGNFVNRHPLEQHQPFREPYLFLHLPLQYLPLMQLMLVHH